jgi:methyltransferase
MNTVAAAFSVIVGLMLAELRVSRVNERRLRERGAFTPPGDVYAAMSVLYPGAFLGMAIEGMWRAMNDAGATTSGPNWAVSGVLLFAASKALKYWAIASLGERWTFKVFVVPGLPLVTTGPYRYVAHPNYIALVGELVGAAMMCGAPIAGVLGLIGFGSALWRRIRFESGVLRRVQEEGR